MKEIQFEQFIANPPWIGVVFAAKRKWNGPDIFDKIQFETEKNSLK